MKSLRVLIIDDDEGTRQLLRLTFAAEHFDVLEASNGVTALQIVEKESPDIVILDVMLPGIDGFEVLMRLRQWSRVPVIALSGRTNMTDKVSCLKLGADDYLTKPFGPEELVARIEAVLRRQGKEESPKRVSFDHGLFRIDFEGKTVKIAGRDIQLNNKEYRLLSELVTKAGKVLSKEYLLITVWGAEYAGDDGVLYPYISRLRAKIEPDPAHPRYIVTVPRAGYRFQMAATPSDS